MSLSRSGSPSKGFAPLVHLDNLETLQDRWAKQAAGLKRPPPSPVLTSPRSLRACQLCGLNAYRDLEKLSLKQCLTQVLGEADVERKAARLLEEMEPKAGLQVAVLAFQRAAIGMGTAKEKLVAYDAFQRQEAQRVPRLASAQEVRRQIMAEEAYDRRRRTHAERSSERSNVSRSPRTSSSTGSRGKRRENTRWSSTAAALVGDAVAARDLSSSSHQSPREDRRSARPSRQSSREISGQKTPSATSSAVAQRRLLDEPRRSVSPKSPGRSLNDFVPPIISDGYLPYVPRNAASLNSNYFANRATDNPASNSLRSPRTRAASEGTAHQSRFRPADRSPAGDGDPMGDRRRRPDLPRHEEAPDKGDHTNVSVDVEKISPGGRNDISIASINSSQLGWVLDSSDNMAATSPAIRGGAVATPPPQLATHNPAAPVSMFHHHQHQQRKQGLDRRDAAVPPPPSKQVGTTPPMRTAAPPQPRNKTSTPPRMAGIANLKAAIEARRQQKAQGNGIGTEPAQSPEAVAATKASPAPLSSIQSARAAAPLANVQRLSPGSGEQQIARQAERALRNHSSPPPPSQTATTDKGDSFFIFCANPVPYCHV